MTLSTTRFDAMAHCARAIVREIMRPVFVTLPSRLRPYALALLLFTAAGAVMVLDDAALMRYGLPWSLVAIMIVVAAANFWGTRPAAVVLALSAVYEALVPPHFLLLPGASRAMLVTRTLLFAACGAAVVWLTDRARRMQERAEIRRQVVVALQTMILPGTLPQVPGYDVGAVYRPARREEEVGGDFYDVFPVADGLYGVLIGDVMGKGKEAAASTALLRYTLKAYASASAGPAQAVARLNDLLETQGTPFFTATLFLGFLDVRHGSLRYCNAGHEPPLVRRADGSQEALAATAVLVGVGRDMPFAEGVTPLSPGDALLLLTDGMTEARSTEGMFLGADGAWRLLADALPAPTAADALAALDTALEHYARVENRDDITMLLLRCLASCPAAGGASEAVCFRN